jgi:hypothetical protein
MRGHCGLRFEARELTRNLLMDKKDIPKDHINKRIELPRPGESGSAQRTLKIAHQTSEQVSRKVKAPWHIHLWKMPKWLWGSIVVIGGILTLLEGFYAFFPFVAVQPNEETSSAVFDDTRWIISNNYPLTMYNVCFSIDAWDGDPAPGIPEIVYNGGELIGRDTIPPHQQITKRCTIMGAHFDLSQYGLPGLKKIERPYYNIWISYDVYPFFRKRIE